MVTADPGDTHRGGLVRITVDPDRCCSAGVCVMTAPDVFDQSDDDGTVVLLTELVDRDTEGAVREAAALCPSRAIELAGAQP